MFLLARLVMDNLIDQDCRQDLEEELSDENLPNGIDQAWVSRSRRVTVMCLHF